MKPESLAWLAGIWDGEGTVAAYRGRVAVSLQMTHRPTIDRIAEVLQGVGIQPGVYSTPTQAPHHAPKWIVQINSHRGQLELARLLVPYAVTKRLQWILLIEYLVGRSMARRGGVRGGPSYNPRQHAIWAEFSALNHRRRRGEPPGQFLEPESANRVYGRQRAGVDR